MLIHCPNCSVYNDIDNWNRTTRNYGEENDIKGRFGGSWYDNAFVVCPNCKSQIDLDRFKRAVEDAEDDY